MAIASLARTMRTFECACGERVFFENSLCLSCQRELAFVPETLTLCALEPQAGGTLETKHGTYRKCENYSAQGVCNWLVPDGAEERLCEACRLNRVIPDLSNPENHRLWAEVERAKRGLLYGLRRIGLPVESKASDPERGLAFDIKADTESEHVLTGHSDGLITLNLAEADPVTREKVRESMNERYRTLLGHFRHEIGHYYFPRLVPEEDRAGFRKLFGDETCDYGAALAEHYATPPNGDFHAEFISSYARAHPAEDWAETFAHYLHMLDTLETAQNFGLVRKLPPRVSVPGISDLELLFAEWTELTIAMNALNRSMGLPDAYPFSLSNTVCEKIGFVHRCVRKRASRNASEPGRAS
jgi:hypothetical protein